MKMDTITSHTNSNRIFYLLSKLIKVIILFLYIYEFNFDTYGLPTFITTRRISILVLFIILVLNLLFRFKGNRKFKEMSSEIKQALKDQIYLQLVVLIYSIIIVLFIGRGQGENFLDDIIKLLLFGVFPIFLFYQLFDSLEDFMGVLLMTTIIQATIVVLCLVSPGFTALIDTTYESQYCILHRNGYAGGLACITAPGLFRYSMGLIALLYFTITRQKSFLLFLYVILGFIGTMIARTGLFVSTIGVIFILFCFSKENKVMPIIRATLTLLFVVMICMIILEVFFLDDWLSFTFRRLIRLFERGIDDGFMQGYLHGADNTYVAINSKTFFGIGVTSGISGNGVAVNVDGGYLRLTAALGIVMASLFYVFLFTGLIKSAFMISDKYVRMTFMFFILILVLGEFKEYTFYSQYMFCLMFVFLSLASKDGFMINKKDRWYNT